MRGKLKKAAAALAEAAAEKEAAAEERAALETQLAAAEATVKGALAFRFELESEMVPILAQGPLRWRVKHRCSKASRHFRAEWSSEIPCCRDTLMWGVTE